MAEAITLSDVDQDAFDAAETLLITLLREENPTLDARKGTVLRDLLIRQTAIVVAADNDRYDQLQARMSLNALREDPTAAEPDDVNDILSNFLVSRNPGELSTGSIQIKVSGVTGVTLAAGTRFSTLGGLQFALSELVSARIAPDLNAGEVPLVASDDGTYYYFIAPAQSVEAGADYNINEGTVLDPSTTIYGFITAQAYTLFAGGVTDETITEAITRLPTAISHRAMESRRSIEAQLRDQFEDSDITIQALSTQGYGDLTQLRDKHNPMGFAVGSRVDIYARTFVAPTTVTILKEATLVAGSYVFTLAPADAPGFYAIRSISEPEAVISPDMDFGAVPVLGSYAFTEVRSAVGVADTFHDIDASTPAEAYFTVYQQAVVTLTGVAPAGTTHTFKVEVYVAPGLDDIQTFVDSDQIRNLEADQLVRCPLICLVGVNVMVYYDSRFPVDAAQLEQDLAAYINTRSFVPRLMRSELASILHSGGVTRIDMTDTGFELSGTINDAEGTTHVLAGDSLDITTIEDADALIADETCVFAAEECNIHVEIIAE